MTAILQRMPFSDQPGVVRIGRERVKVKAHQIIAQGEPPDSEYALAPQIARMAAAFL